MSLLHHVQGPQAYDFLVVDGSTLWLGHVVDGERSTFATETAQGEDWQRIRVVGDGTHFRGYVDGAMVVHGHGEVAPAGAEGLRLDGQGTVRVRRLTAESL